MATMKMLTGKPAFAKAAIEVKDIQFGTDGSVDGCYLKIDGKNVENLLMLSIYMYNDEYGDYLGCSYSVGDNSQDVTPGNFSENHTYRLIARREKTTSGKATAKAGLDTKPIPSDILRTSYASILGIGDFNKG